MGSVSMDNSGVEKRLDSVEEKVSENTSALNTGFSQMFSNMKESLTQFKIFNRHQEIITNAKYKPGDVEDA